MQKTNIDQLDAKEKFVETKSIGIDGMTCDRCVQTIEKALRAIKGVQKLEVDLETKTATVTFDNRQTNMPALHDALLARGYRPTATVEE